MSKAGTEGYMRIRIDSGFKNAIRATVYFRRATASSRKDIHTDRLITPDQACDQSTPSSYSPYEKSLLPNCHHDLIGVRGIDVDCVGCNTRGRRGAPPPQPCRAYTLNRLRFNRGDRRGAPSVPHA